MTVGARVFLGLQLAGEALVLTDVVTAAAAARAVRVVAAQARLLRAEGFRIAVGVGRRRTRRRGTSVGGRIDRLGRLLPLRLLGVDVDVEPLVVLIVPLGLPALGDFWRRWALRRRTVSADRHLVDGWRCSERVPAWAVC